MHITAPGALALQRALAHLGDAHREGAAAALVGCHRGTYTFLVAASYAPMCLVCNLSRHEKRGFSRCWLVFVSHRLANMQRILFEDPSRVRSAPVSVCKSWLPQSRPSSSFAASHSCRDGSSRSLKVSTRSEPWAQKKTGRGALKIVCFLRAQRGRAAVPASLFFGCQTSQLLDTAGSRRVP